MPALRCPRCATTINAAVGTVPVCPKCGLRGPPVAATPPGPRAPRPSAPTGPRPTPAARPAVRTPAPPPAPAAGIIPPPSPPPRTFSAVAEGAAPKKRTGVIVVSIVIALVLLGGAAAGAYFIFREKGGDTFPESYAASSYDVPDTLRLVRLDESETCTSGAFASSLSESLGMTENPGYADIDKLSEDSDAGEPVPERAYIALYVAKSDCDSILLTMAAEMKSEADVAATIDQADGPCSSEGGLEFHVLTDGPVFVAVGAFPGSDLATRSAATSLADQIQEATGATDPC